jgi:SAM-dependent methyltransferase
MTEINTEIKEEVKQFYDQVGWQLVSADFYQNARYEDLRPVSRQYIHRCHARIASHIQPQGRYMLDAGSGPVQYPEYLEYSRNYQYRVCADISITALKEARKRVNEHGLYVVADVANLPFKADIFEGVISLHTIHHLPEEEHVQAYAELHRVLAPHSRAVVVNGWPSSRLMKMAEPFVRAAQKVRYLSYRMTGRGFYRLDYTDDPDVESESAPKRNRGKNPKGTYTSRHDVEWVKNEIGALMPVDILVWRSVSVRFLRALIHPRLGGRAWLGLLFRLEERYPHFFGERGKYPLIVIHKA